jgi:ABC-type sulfate transport system permease subunit
MAITTIPSPLIVTQVFAFFTQQHSLHYQPAGAFAVAAALTLMVLIPLCLTVNTKRHLQ